MTSVALARSDGRTSSLVLGATGFACSVAAALLALVAADVRRKVIFFLTDPRLLRGPSPGSAEASFSGWTPGEALRALVALGATNEATAFRERLEQSPWSSQSHPADHPQ
jgi:hypothetical protein